MIPEEQQAHELAMQRVATPDNTDNEQLQQPGENRNDFIMRQIDRALIIQRPMAIKFARKLRADAPDATPGELMTRAEKWYRRTVMGTGGGVGAAAVVPGVGTVTGLALAGAEVVTFFEFTALYALVIAELSGTTVDDPERARTLVMAIMLGDRGRKMVTEFLRHRNPGALMQSAFWGELVSQATPKAMMGELGGRVRNAFVRRYVNRQATGVIGKIIPFGVGAAIGALGNRALANEVIRTARGAFGEVPGVFRGELHDDVMAQRELDRLERKTERKGLFGRKKHDDPQN